VSIVLTKASLSGDFGAGAEHLEAQLSFAATLPDNRDGKFKFDVVNFEPKPLILDLPSRFSQFLSQVFDGIR